MILVPRAGFEPATTRSSAERSPRLSYLGTFFWAALFFGEAKKFVSWILIYVFIGIFSDTAAFNATNMETMLFC